MKTGIVKYATGMALLILTGALLAGCGQTEQGKSVTKIKIATSGSPNPFSFVDEDNVIKGYDVDVIKAVFDRLPQYETEIEVADFPSIFAGLDSDKYQVGVNNFSYNKDRAEKYIYTTAHFKNSYVIAVAQDNNEINHFEDLLGKSTQVSPNTTYASSLAEYNEEHSDNPVDISYSEEDLVYILQNIEDGQYDFQLIDEPMFNVYMNEFDLKLKGVKLTDEEMNLITPPYSYILVGKGNEQLAEDINAVLKELVEDGTIAGISKEYFLGNDYTPYDQYKE
ncbi:MAG: transporter substrate-binding domain-containing protein [Lachnospiraceae bacterium]